MILPRKFAIFGPLSDVLLVRFTSQGWTRRDSSYSVAVKFSRAAPAQQQLFRHRWTHATCVKFSFRCCYGFAGFLSLFLNFLCPYFLKMRNIKDRTAILINFIHFGLCNAYLLWLNVFNFSFFSFFRFLLKAKRLQNEEQIYLTLKNLKKMKCKFHYIC